MISPDGMCHVVNPRCSTDPFPIALKASRPGQWAVIWEKVQFKEASLFASTFFEIFSNGAARRSLQSDEKYLKNVDFSLLSRQICYCIVFPFLEYCASRPVSTSDRISFLLLT